jgi:hypothetical protein
VNGHRPYTVGCSSGDAVNNFQLLTMWIVAVTAGVGCVCLLVWASHRRRSRLLAPPPSARSYQITGRFVEICVADGCSLTDLRALFESIRDDPTLPAPALLLFDGRGRSEWLSDADVRSRLAVFLDILRPHMVPAYAVIVSSAIVSSARAAQRYAAARGVRAELFPDVERARGWLSTCAPISDRV